MTQCPAAPGCTPSPAKRKSGFVARAVLDGLGQATDDFTTNARYTDLIKLVRARGRIVTDAWLTDAGHLRPGMNKGLPLAEAQAKAAELDPKIREAAAALAGNP